MRCRTLVLLILLPQVACGACIAPLPQPMNAVAVASLDDRAVITSFMGLTAGETPQDISRRARLWDEGNPGWQELPHVPVDTGRLAATQAVLDTIHGLQTDPTYPR